MSEVAVQQAKTIGKSILDNKVAVAAISVGLIGLFVVRPIIKVLTKDKQTEDFEKGVQEVIKKAASDGTVTTTITALEAKSIADRLEIAMRSSGTDEDALFQALGNLNGKDLQLVYANFGLRSYFPFTGESTADWMTKFGWGQKQDLFGWFDEELGGSDLSQMKSLWAKSGLAWGVKIGGTNSAFKLKIGDSIKAIKPGVLANLNGKTARTFTTGEPLGQIVKFMYLTTSTGTLKGYQVSLGGSQYLVYESQVGKR